MAVRGVYVRRIVDDPATLDATAWDQLLEQQASPTPFMSGAYLRALHQSGSACGRTGWSPRFVLLEDAQGLAAAAPVYAKTHSWGEYVFDGAWAHAYQRHGLRYYPKLLCAVPFTPVPGTRLLARDAPARDALARSLVGFAREEDRSSVHVLFADATDRTALCGPADPDAGQAQPEPWMWRAGVQFHWQMPDDRPWPDFDTMLGSLQRHKRKNILQERRKVCEAGVRFETFEGEAIDESLWDFFYACYTATYHAHGGYPYLTRAFWAAMQRDMADHWVMFVASHEGRRIAASLIAVDPVRRTAWGRYWGCTETVPLLHFEACYYQPLAWCIARGYRRFEGGAQGEHKMARGLMPTATGSAHWLADARFAQAVDDFLAREGQGVASYLGELAERNPFRTACEPLPSSPGPR